VNKLQWIQCTEVKSCDYFPEFLRLKAKDYQFPKNIKGSINPIFLINIYYFYTPLLSTIISKQTNKQTNKSINNVI